METTCPSCEHKVVAIIKGRLRGTVFLQCPNCNYTWWKETP